MTNKDVKTKLPMLTAGALLVGFLALIAALAVAPSIAAQDPVDGPDDLPDVVIIESEADLQKLSPEARLRFEREGTFADQDSSDLSESTKTANRNTVYAGEEVLFTIRVVNSGDMEADDVVLTDTLPDDLDFVGLEYGEFKGAIGDSEEQDGNTYTWTGTIIPGGYLEVIITAFVDDSVQIGTEIKNTAVITWSNSDVPGESLQAEPSATVVVGDPDSEPISVLPLVVYGEKPFIPDIPTVSASRPNAANTWTLSWDGAGGTFFEIQESQSLGFENAAIIETGTETSMPFAHSVSPYNVYYYRVRSAYGDMKGNWSEPVKVVGGYRDDFTSDATGWTLRRQSLLDDRVNAWYEFYPDLKWHIVQVKDRWDLGLTSPLAEAPAIPYAINLEVQSVQPGWQKGLGIVFAGDKVTEQCPSDPNSEDGWYKHTDCFNEFYEFMLVEGADKRNLQVQRVHEVEWLGSNAGGIPIHRKVAKNWYIEKINDVSWEDFNRMRVEVRQDQIMFFAAKQDHELRLQLIIDENMYPENAYFGTIATTQEYSNMTARYEFFEAVPLDS